MDFLRAQFTKIPLVAPRDLSKSTVLVTGANTGIGFETAKELLKSKPERLIIACRNNEKGLAAKQILEQSNEASTKIEVRQLDQSSFESVKSFARGLEGESVDIVILNAGVFGSKWTSTRDGYETDLQVNTLAPALLSVMLLPNLHLAKSKTPQDSRQPHFRPHLTIVSSGLHEMAKFKESEEPTGGIIPALNDRSRYNQQDRYPTSKTMALHWTRELAARVSSDSVVINAPNPGFCKTSLLGNTTGFMTVVVQIFSALFGRPAPDGARCIVDAVLHKGPESHGKYLTEMAAKPEGELVAKVKDLNLRKRVWSEILEHINRADPQLREP